MPVSEPVIRLGIFFGILCLMLLWETQVPRRALSFARRQRWPWNLGVGALNVGVVRLLIPTTAAGLATTMEGSGLGLLNQIDLPVWLAVALAVLVLDFAIYVQHLVFHHVSCPVALPPHASR